MISVIICSRAKIIKTNLFQNIKNTIGCKYELIVIDNSENKFSIFQAYNLGIEKSLGDYLCFLHDDVFIHTDGWGSIIQRVFRDDLQLGVLGIAGSKVKTKMPSGWWNCPNMYKDINIIQHTFSDLIEKWNYGFKTGTISEVVSIDGVFIVLRKEHKLLFNKKLEGFHNYDLNICLECKIKGYKIAVTNEILIEHFSNGSVNKEWYKSTLNIHEIYKDSLPAYLSDETKMLNLKILEIKNGFNFLKYYVRFGLNFSILKLWFNILLIGANVKIHFEIFKMIVKSFKIESISRLIIKLK